MTGADRRAAWRLAGRCAVVTVAVCGPATVLLWLCGVR